MKRNQLPLLLCAVVLIASAAKGQTSAQAAHRTGLSDPLKWRTYTIKGEQFEVALPTLPAMKTERNFNQRLGKRRLEMRLNTSLEGVTYTIDVFHHLEPPQSLEHFIAEANSEYDLTTARDLTVDGVAGKEYSSQDKSSPSTRQFFVTRRGLFRFTATGSIKAAKRIKFTPAMKDGKPVSLWMQLEYNFNL